MEEEIQVFQEKTTADDTLYCMLFVRISVHSGTSSPHHLSCLLALSKLHCKDAFQCAHTLLGREGWSTLDVAAYALQ